MFEEILVQQNPHWSGENYEDGVPRSCFPKLVEYFASGQVVAITGVRRAGKSTLIKQLINYLISVEQVPGKNILFLNLEHPYLSL